MQRSMPRTDWFIRGSSVRSLLAATRRRSGRPTVPAVFPQGPSGGTRVHPWSVAPDPLDLRFSCVSKPRANLYLGGLGGLLRIADGDLYLDNGPLACLNAWERKVALDPSEVRSWRGHGLVFRLVVTAAFVAYCASPGFLASPYGWLFSDPSNRVETRIDQESEVTEPSDPVAPTGTTRLEPQRDLSERSPLEP